MTFYKEHSFLNHVICYSDVAVCIAILSQHGLNKRKEKQKKKKRQQTPPAKITPSLRFSEWLRYLLSNGCIFILKSVKVI
jgi:hypothetical protein